MVDVILGDFKSNERELVKQHITNIEDKINLEKTLIIFDRGYISLELMLFLKTKVLNIYSDLMEGTIKMKF